jgi:DNA-binding NarL/FixJ family response regulator
MTQESGAGNFGLTPETPSVMKVVVIEDLREVREGLTALINGTRGFKCVGSYFSMEAALARIGDDPPDVILTDIGLPGMSGIEGIAILRGMFPEVPILTLTVYDNDQHILMLFVPELRATCSKIQLRRACLNPSKKLGTVVRRYHLKSRAV